MEEAQELKGKYCVLIGCSNKAVGFCNNCRIPVCNLHAKRINNVYLCINCLKYMKKFKLRS